MMGIVESGGPSARKESSRKSKAERMLGAAPSSGGGATQSRGKSKAERMLGTDGGASVEARAEPRSTLSKAERMLGASASSSVTGGIRAARTNSAPKMQRSNTAQRGQLRSAMQKKTVSIDVNAPSLLGAFSPEHSPLRHLDGLAVLVRKASRVVNRSRSNSVSSTDSTRSNTSSSSHGRANTMFNLLSPASRTREMRARSASESSSESTRSTLSQRFGPGRSVLSVDSKAQLVDGAPPAAGGGHGKRSGKVRGPAPKVPLKRAARERVEAALASSSGSASSGGILGKDARARRTKKAGRQHEAAARRLAAKQKLVDARAAAARAKEEAEARFRAVELELEALDRAADAEMAAIEAEDQRAEVSVFYLYSTADMLCDLSYSQFDLLPHHLFF